MCERFDFETLGRSLNTLLTSKGYLTRSRLHDMTRFSMNDSAILHSRAHKTSKQQCSVSAEFGGYSKRSAVIGSTLVARAAGTHTAAKATMLSNNGVRRNARRSHALTPKRKLERNRLSQNAAAIPITTLSANYRQPPYPHYVISNRSVGVERRNPRHFKTPLSWGKSKRRRAKVLSTSNSS